MKKIAIGVSILLVASLAYGGGFLKGGIIVHPDVGGISERWLISTGSDYYIGDMVALGLEIQTAYHSSNNISSVPLNGFINLKVRPNLSGVKPVVGVGFGLMSNILWGDNVDLTFSKNTGMHLIGGLEFGMSHGPAFTVELQALRSFATGASFTYVILGGVRF